MKSIPMTDVINTMNVTSAKPCIITTIIRLHRPLTNIIIVIIIHIAIPTVKRPGTQEIENADTLHMPIL